MAARPIVETGRLKLREFTHEDLDVLAAMVDDAEQMTFYPRPKTREEAAAWIDHNLALYDGHGFGFWLVESLSDSSFQGYCGIRPLPLEEADEIEIGWHTKKSSWNQGIAGEAARAARALAATRFGVPRLVALIHPHHIASRRVAENIGMHPQRTTVLENDYPAIVYSTETFRSVPLEREPARSLLQAMREEIAAIYDDLDLDGPDMPTAGHSELGSPRGDFLVGFDALGNAVCCGGIKELPDGACEIKRLFVRPEARGRGVAGRLLAALESRARELGYEVVRLDTGPRQPHSERLFLAAGYRPIANFNANPVATFFGEKRL